MSSWGVFLVIGAMVFLAYLPSLRHGFLMDDESVVLRNPAAADLRRLPELFRRDYFNFEGPRAELWKTYYRPLTSTTFALNHFFFGGRPWAYNAANLLLHTLVTFLLYLFLRDALGVTSAAFCAALVYALHTVNTEAVAYVSSRSDLLAALFILLGLRAYWGGRRTIALFCQLAALFSKESSLFFPIELMALDAAFMPAPISKRLKRLWPFFFLSAAYVLYRQAFCAVPLASAITDAPRETLLRVLSCGPAFVEYAKAVLRPEPFKFCLAFPFASGFHDPRVIETVLMAAGFAAGLILAWKKNKACFFGLAFFAASFLPYIQIVRFKPAWAEHYLYVPAIGLALAFGCMLRWLFRGPGRPARLVFVAAYALWALFLFHETRVRSSFYGDASAFYQKLSASDSPYAYYGYTRRAEQAMREERWEDAGALLRTAEKMEPSSDTVHHLLGVYSFKKGEYAEALGHFDKAYEYAVVHDPRYRARSAMALFQMGRFSEAARIYEDLQRSDPADAEIYTNLLMIHEMMGDPKKARDWAELGLQNVKKGPDNTLLSMALVRLAYRQGWDDLVRERLDRLAASSSNEFWYSDIVRLLRGEDDPARFLPALRAKYADSDLRSALRLYVLMALVLKDDKNLLRTFFDENRPELERIVEKRPLFKKELERAERALGFLQ